MPAKTKTRRVRKAAAGNGGATRTDNDIAAVYTGLGHTEGRCAIGKCAYTVNGANYSDTRFRMAQHRELAH